MSRGGHNQPRVVVASHYDVAPRRIYNGLCWETARVLAQMSGGTPLSLQGEEASYWDRVTHRSARFARMAPPTHANPVDMPECDLLFYVAMLPRHLSHLQALRQWRKRAKKAAVFLFETWSSQVEANRPYYRLLDQFDHVFLFNAPSVPAVQRATSAPCSYLPAATDCLTSSPASRDAPRPIDIYGMGRNAASVHEQLVQMAMSGELFYHWDAGGRVDDGYQTARFRTHDLLRRSRFFLSFDFDIGSKAKEAAGEQAIPARVFEGAACGAAMLGTAPRSPEFRELFDWPDAVFELPRPSLDVRSLYAELSKQPDRVREAGTRAAVESLRRHDWAYRWRVILDRLGLPEPTGLRRRLDDLEQRAELLERAPAEQLVPARAS